MAVEGRPIATLNASFDDLPIICASRLAYAVFRAGSRRIQTQITRNTVEPEALQMALAVFYCTTGREAPIPYTSYPEGEPELEGYPPFQFPFQLPFPTQPSEIARFFFLCKTVQFVAERLTSKSLAYSRQVLNPEANPRVNSGVKSGVRPSAKSATSQWVRHTVRHAVKPRVERDNVLLAGVVASLTTEERIRLEKKLYQYELVTTALNHGGHRRYLEDREHNFTSFISSPRRWLADMLLEGVGVVESQQLVTVEALILDDYWILERDFQISFADEIVKAAEKAKATFLNPPCDPASHKVNCNDFKSPMINARQALAAEDVATTFNFSILSHQESWDVEIGSEWDFFTATLQTFGLKWYKRLLEASPTERKKLLLHAHRRHQSIRSVHTYCPVWPLCAMALKGWKLSIREYRVESEQVKYPNAYIEKYFAAVERADPGFYSIRRSSSFLFQTGLWLWDGANLSRMDFERVFRKYTRYEDLKKKWADEYEVSTFRGERETNPPTAIDLVGERDELPLSVWRDIIDKYQMEGAGVGCCDPKVLGKRKHRYFG
ncbi:hypothetical protein ANO14919_044010 [Xylariales sp. No.14919]|nr:hypothetical protein ANO14919_044010 [Xylariales sp. No.14919]